MTRLVLAMLLCAPSWGAYAYKRTVTIDASKVGGSPQTNFPVLISGTYAYLATAANGGRLQNANGYDLDFFSDAALTSPLQWERVVHTLTDGRVEIWVKLPALSNTANTVIYMAYGDVSVTTDQSDGGAAWTDYTAVWHFRDGTTLDVNDSKGTYNLTASSATATTGKVDGGIAFNGSTGYAYKNTSGNGMTPNTGLTVTGWIYITAAGNWSGPFGYHSDSNGYTWKFNGTTRKFNWICRGSWLEYGTALATSTWYHIATVASSGGTKIYVNGVEVASKATDPALASIWSDGQIRAGRSMDGNYMPGTVDEMRVRRSLVSADWILAEYNNQSSPGTFYTVGIEGPATGRGRVVIAMVRGNQ